jgi:hypothetical protein
VLFQKLDDLADGDGAKGATFKKDSEIEALLAHLRSLSTKPLLLTEGVYRAVVGEEL